MVHALYTGGHSNLSPKYRDIGEKMAVDFLLKKGYKILEKNFRFGKLEVDIIALKNDTVVFVEVKRREKRDYGNPEEFVDARKQRRVMKVARFYMSRNGLFDTHHVRFDVISITGEEIFHIEGAYREH
ncbi:YraN family protein [candidate division WOR-3 bacterium]|nr:YraN family protein [candidate division WOR-3 bacterium]